MSVDPSPTPPTVTVIIPARGVARYIEPCLDSVLQQTLRDLEVLVMDDASPDGLAAIVTARASDDPRVRLIQLEQCVGQGLARNRGIEAARGTYIFFLDGDDVLASPRTLQRLVELADAQEADMVRGRKLHAHDPIDPHVSNPRDPTERFFSTRIRSGDIHALPELWHNRHFWLFLYRRQFLVASTIRFENPQWEERPFLVAAFLAAKHIVLSDFPAVLYRIREDSTARRDRDLHDMALLVRNAELVCELLAPERQPALRAARELTVRQYVGFLLGNSRWHGLLSEDDEVRPLLERYLSALERLNVAPAAIRSEIDIEGPLSATDGDCLLLWHLLHTRELAAARRFARDGEIPPEELYPALLGAPSPLTGVLNDWLRTREWPAPNQADVCAPPETASPQATAPAPRRRLVLHIGATKTGSTYLQHLCDRNRLELLQHGVWYPACGYVRQPRRPHKSAAHARFAEYARAGDARLRQQLELDLTHLGDRVHTVLLSSEAFFLGRHPEALAAYFEDFEVHVVVYLRRQDDWIQSQYCEFVAGGAVGRTRLSLEDWLARPESRDCLDYHATLTAWRDAIGSDRIRVRPYEPSQFSGGSLVRDFGEAAGLPDLESMSAPAPQERNAEAPTLLTLSAMRLMNGLPFPDPVTYLSFARDALALLARQPRDPSAAQLELLGSERRLAILRDVEDGNASVARAFLGRPDGRLFLDMEVQPASCAPLAPAIPSDLLESLVDIYQRSLPPSTPRKPRAKDSPKPKREVLRVENGVQLGDTTYLAALDSLCELRPRPFLQAVALLANMQPMPKARLETLAAQLREGRIQKRQAAAALLRQSPGLLWKAQLPIRDKLELQVRMHTMRPE